MFALYKFFPNSVGGDDDDIFPYGIVRAMKCPMLLRVASPPMVQLHSQTNKAIVFVHCVFVVDYLSNFSTHYKNAQVAF